MGWSRYYYTNMTYELLELPRYILWAAGNLDRLRLVHGRESGQGKNVSDTNNVYLKNIYPDRALHGFKVTLIND